MLRHTAESKGSIGLLSWVICALLQGHMTEHVRTVHEGKKRIYKEVNCQVGAFIGFFILSERPQAQQTTIFLSDFLTQIHTGKFHLPPLKWFLSLYLNSLQAWQKNCQANLKILLT